MCKYILQCKDNKLIYRNKYYEAECVLRYVTMQDQVFEIVCEFSWECPCFSKKKNTYTTALLTSQISDSSSGLY